MKKIYFLASMLLMGSAASAQIQTSLVMRAANEELTVNNVRPGNTAQDRAPGDVIGSYTDDFSTPGNWTLANTGSPSTNFTISSVGPASEPNNILNSTSGGNFAWYDCDAQGSGSTVDATLTYATSFNLTSNPAVMVQFEQFYRDYYEDTYVEVSIDGGTNWTQYAVNENYLPNAGSPTNPVVEQVNISSLAGGQSNVMIRFHYVGGWGWSWQIDDFALVEAYSNELETSSAYFSSGTEMADYYAVPTSQITEITFGALATQNGSVQQTNVQMTANVDGGTTFTANSSQVVSLNEGQVDTFSVESPNGWTPAGSGSYDLDIYVSATETEEYTANDTVSFEPIVVGGNVYARDNGIISGSFSGFVSTAGDPIAIGNTFEIFQAESFGKIQIGLSSATTSENQLMYGAIYIYNSGTQEFDYVMQTADYTVTAADIGTLVTLELPSNYNASAGEILLVLAGRYTDDLAIAEAQATQANTVLAIHSSGTIGSSTPSAIICRLSTEPTSVGIDEVEAANGIHMYPNPANLSTQLTYNVITEGNVALTLTDLSGKVVSTENFGSQVAGQYQVNVNTADLADGVYFYTLTVGDFQQTKKFVVQH